MAAKAPPSRKELRSSRVKTWNLPGFDDPFVQDPLTFFEKNEFFALVARAVEEVVMTTGDVTSLLSLLGIDDAALAKIKEGEVDPDLMLAVPGMVGVLTRLVSAVPGQMEEVFLLALSVPLERRMTVREGLRQIDDDTGFGIMEAFVDQNVDTMRDFLPRWRGFLESLKAKLLTGPEPAPVATLTD